MERFGISPYRTGIPARAYPPEPVAAARYHVSQEPAPDSLDFVSYAQMLYRRKRTLVLVTLAGTALALAISIVQPRTYRSVAVVEIQPANEDFLNLREISPTATPPSSTNESYVQTQAELLRQEALLKRMVQKMELYRRREYAPRLTTWQRLRSVAGLSSLPLPPGEQYALELVKKDLSIVPSRDSRIIEIVYDAPDPQLAAGVANNLATSFIEQSVEARWSAAREVREWLRPQLDDLKTKLEQSQTELQDYVRSSGLQLTSSQQNLGEDNLRRVQEELSKAQADRVAKQSVYYSAVNGQPEALTENAAVQEYRLRLADLRRQLADLETLLTPESYKIQRLKNQIAAVESSLQKEIITGRNRLRGEYLAAQSRESLLEKTFSAQWSKISDLSSKMTKYDTLKHEVEAKRQFYEDMMMKANEAGIASVIRPSNIRLANTAQPPLRPNRPNLPLNLTLGTFLGLLLGIGLITTQEHMVRPLRAPGDAQAYLSLPELGAIPSAESSLYRRLLKPADAADGRLELVSWEQKLSDMSESFRGAVTSMLLASVNGGGPAPRVIVVSSPLPGEGKTTVASNLGITLAGLGRRVLLVDGDIRRPRLHQIFDIANTHGLSSTVREKTTIEELPLEGFAYKTKVPNLFVLPSGPGTDAIASLLHSTRMQKLIRRFREEFDHVLIDVPPALTYADARLLAHYADGVVLVIRANRTYDKTVLAVIQRFLMDGVPVLGTVLNAWNPRGAGAYGYPGYKDVYYRPSA